MNDLPSGWTQTTLGAVGQYSNGRGFKKSEWSETGRPIIRIQNLTGSSNSFNHFNGHADESYIARNGDLLMAWAATLGAHIWRGSEAVVNQHIFRVTPRIDRRFLKYLLDFKLSELMQETHGSGMVHITRKKFENVSVAVPNSEIEQRAIADQLDDHFSRLDAAEAGFNAAEKKIISLRERVITARLLGEFELGARRHAHLAPAGTNDGQLPALPENWTWRRLSETADVVGGITKDAGRQSDPSFVEVPFLRVANVQRGHLRLSDVRTIRVAPEKAAALRLLPGDVLMNEGGDRDKLARGWVWQGEISDCIHQNHVFRARVKDESIEPRLLSWGTNTMGGRWAERNGKQSVNLASISLTVIRKMPVVVPPRDLQERIVREITSDLEGCDAMHRSLIVQRVRSANLRTALLQAAFRGRLSRCSGDTDLSGETALV